MTVRRPLKFSMDKRAITPVLSNLLLMVVAVAAMSIAATATFIVTTNLKEAMGERLIIEDVWFNTSKDNHQISIYLRNVGKTEVRISDVYVNYTRQPSIALSPQKLRLEMGNHGWLNISFDWESGCLYHLDIVTLRGTRVGGYYKAP